MTEILPFPRRTLPPLARVRQRLSSEHIADVRGETHERLLAAGLREKVRPGAVVAVTAGSRGMGGFVELVAGWHGLWPSVLAVPRLTMSKAKILFGVAVVENAFRQPVIVEVVPPRYEAFKEADERLLEACPTQPSARGCAEQRRRAQAAGDSLARHIQQPLPPADG